MAVVERWRNRPQPSYNLNRRNCVHFVGELAEAVGLRVEYVQRLMKRPRSFLQHVRSSIRSSPPGAANRRPQICVWRSPAFCYQGGSSPISRRGQDGGKGCAGGIARPASALAARLAASPWPARSSSAPPLRPSSRSRPTREEIERPPPERTEPPARAADRRGRGRAGALRARPARISEHPLHPARRRLRRSARPAGRTAARRLRALRRAGESSRDRLRDPRPRRHDPARGRLYRRGRGARAAHRRRRSSVSRC